MRLPIALFIPWLVFFTIKRPVAGIICLILQLTLIGWIPATIWAVYALSQYKTDQKIKQAIEAVGVSAAPAN
ncbi:twitching motility protein PilT [Burkholderiales bacterium GJ-E10]|nr:twitching motility protein PilT [Burkholderiales bacterium GJ-E10]